MNSKNTNHLEMVTFIVWQLVSWWKIPTYIYIYYIREFPKSWRPLEKPLLSVCFESWMTGGVPSRHFGNPKKMLFSSHDCVYHHSMLGFVPPCFVAHVSWWKQQVFPGPLVTPPSDRIPKKNGTWIPIKMVVWPSPNWWINLIQLLTIALVNI